MNEEPTVSTSAGPAVIAESAVVQHVSVNKSSVDAQEFPHLLKQYYDRLFPYGKYFRWLSYGAVSKSYFSNREFSFTLKDDIYIRYRSYADEAEMTEDIKKMCPYKIDLGAIFTDKPKDHKKIKASEFKPVEKEIVFDIDMTDYDDIRTCCSGAAICSKCWPFMNIAVKIVDTALREDFGFENMLWVYSGRRGVHCWVCDKRARALTNEGRSAVAEYLSVVVGSDAQARRVTLRSPMHPAVGRAVEICTKYFEEWVLATHADGGQDILKEPESQRKLLAVIGDERFEAKMMESWDGDGQSSKLRWKELCAELAREAKKDKTRKFSMRKQEIILQYTYPRLDINVSKQLNHLLKSPFVVHPKTGRVCVPIDQEDVDNFDPFTVPTISDLMSDLDEYNAAQPNDEEVVGSRKVKNYQKTKLRDSIDLFDRFLLGLNDEIRAERDHTREANEQGAAATGEW